MKQSCPPCYYDKLTKYVLLCNIVNSELYAQVTTGNMHIYENNWVRLSRKLIEL